MIRNVLSENAVIQYDLQYKKVKNINLRIRADGSVHVSANKHVPVNEIDFFVASKADFILKALQKYNVMRKTKKQYFTENEVHRTIVNFCEHVYPYYEKLGIPFPQIKFRKMTSRWGSCQPKRAVLTFNTNLMFAPLECIEYVVWHEFTHFLQPNHSNKFYDELAKVCPDWQWRRKMLREIVI